MVSNKLQIVAETKATLLRLEGLKCWNISWGYGGTLHFDFGEKVMFSGKEIGEWWFNVDATHFTLTKADGSVFDTRDLDDHFYRYKAQVHEHLTALLDKVISKAILDETTHGVSIIMTDSTAFVVIPTGEDDEITTMDDGELFELPYWGLFMPGKSMIQVGPLGKYRINPPIKRDD
ncbi:MAG: hypothetical protein RLP44_08170 [Aggregatilineales bacterium]